MSWTCDWPPTRGKRVYNRSLRAPALNDAPLFIAALKDLVLGAV